MFPIRTKNNLAVAYVLLRYYEGGLADPNQRDKELVAENVREVKDAIRSFYKKQNQPHDRRVIKDNGIDGFIELCALPEHLKTMDEAEQYFMENEYVDMPHLSYDCSGKLFTGWYKIFNRRGRYMAYHSIHRDC